MLFLNRILKCFQQVFLYLRADLLGKLHEIRSLVSLFTPLPPSIASFWKYNWFFIYWNCISARTLNPYPPPGSRLWASLSMRRSGPVSSPEPEPAVPTGDAHWCPLGQMQRGSSDPWQTSVGSTHDQFWQMEGLCDTSSTQTPFIPFTGAGMKNPWWNPMTASFYLPGEGTYFPPTCTHHNEQASVISK